MEHEWSDAPIDDGSHLPAGTLSEDGTLRVECYEDRDTGQPVKGWVETDLGQAQRWMRQSPDLYALYMALVEEVQGLRAAKGEA